MKPRTASLSFTALMVGFCGELHAQIACTGDLSALGQGQQRIEIKTNSDGSFTAMTNGNVTNAKGVVVDEVIRDNLNLTAEPNRSDFANYNSAERSLVHLHGLLSGPTKALVKMSFDPADVRRVKTYDLIGSKDKFGGRVMLEVFAEAGKPLGKVLRAVLPVECK